MKVLHQIIAYLRSRGLLPKEQLVELASQGILRWDEVYEEREREPEEEPIWEPEEEPEPQDRPRPRPGRGPGPRPSVLGPRDLGQRIAERFEAWRGALDALVQLGRFAGTATWEDAAVAVRNADLFRLAEVLIAGFEARSPTLAALWQALDVDPCDGVLSGTAFGPVGHAYRAVLAARDPAGLGRYVSLLREPEVAAACNLVQAQRRLLRACGAVLRQRPDLVAPGLRRDGAASSYWSFVLLYAARRGRPGRRPWPAGDERPPLRSAPEESAWPHLWSQAVAMDTSAVTPFLVERTRLQAERTPALSRVLENLISSLEDQPREVLYRYYHSGQSAAQVAAGTALPETDVARVLHGFRQDLRQALGAEPATRVLLQPAAARSWDAFLADCLRCTWGNVNYLFDPGREDRYREILLTHYGPAFDLLCPRGWD
jgi:DNA-directed RNA polymerase specialized sigma24 family protein